MNRHGLLLSAFLPFVLAFSLPAAALSAQQTGPTPAAQIVSDTVPPSGTSLRDQERDAAQDAKRTKADRDTVQAAPRKEAIQPPAKPRKGGGKRKGTIG
jgi:hypothetical protein